MNNSPEIQFLPQREPVLQVSELAQMSAQLEKPHIDFANQELGPAEEYIPGTLETLAKPLNPGEMGAVAIAAATELLQTPEVGVEQLESERKKNTNENLRALKNRFSERFVKGDLMEGGGYTGGAARELLASFMDQPGFANELKRLIPSKHGALALLKDNYTYIQATLEQRYKNVSEYERQLAKDPYELARSVGYELTGPFESTDEFVPYDKQDFRSNERLFVPSITQANG